jgi:hypothetical protein
VQIIVLMADASVNPKHPHTLSRGRYLHTGDFRATQEMADHPTIVAAPIDTLYLDTTYCDMR